MIIASMHKSAKIILTFFLVKNLSRTALGMNFLKKTRYSFQAFLKNELLCTLHFLGRGDIRINNCSADHICCYA